MVYEFVFFILFNAPHPSAEQRFLRGSIPRFFRISLGRFEKNNFPHPAICSFTDIQ
jgi:hypothetical protein